MPHTLADTPAVLPAEIVDAYRLHPQIPDLCGEPLGAVLRSGLTNRVYRLAATGGTFFLRLPENDNAQRIDRAVEAHNLALAAKAGLALLPVYCHPASGVLVTRSVEVCDRLPEDAPERLGTALGLLHASGAAFGGFIDADSLRDGQTRRLGSTAIVDPEMTRLAACLEDLAPNQAKGTPPPVPSHGDPSPGNCLFVPDRLWLIDWEYSAMADPAWDLAYATLEHGYTRQEERRFLRAYEVTRGDVPRVTARQIEIMKSKCDAVSALWALEQVAAGREEDVFLLFAHARRDRALARLEKLPGPVT